MVCWSLALKHLRTGFDEVDWSPRPTIYDNAGKGPLGQCANDFRLLDWLQDHSPFSPSKNRILQFDLKVLQELCMEFHIVFESRLDAIATCFR
jgi:hypothetical protein